MLGLKLKNVIIRLYTRQRKGERLNTENSKRTLALLQEQSLELNESDSCYMTNSFLSAEQLESGNKLRPPKTFSEYLSCRVHCNLQCRTKQNNLPAYEAYCGWAA